MLLSLPDSNERLAMRIRTLEACGATPEDQEQLLAYNENKFDHSLLNFPLEFPLASEPQVTDWREYADACVNENVFDVLKEKLVQLRFPIQKGISETEAYRAASRRGVFPPQDHEGQSLKLNRPEGLTLTVHPTPAGEIPVLVNSDRRDFVTMMRALARRNEPFTVPDSMGASMVAGLNNWDRVRRYRERWETSFAGEATEAAWKLEFAQLIPRKELYQDLFILLSDGPYSNVPAESLGLSDDRWRQMSLLIRRDHECTHYFTRRVFGSMRNNLLDEILADYMGIVAAAGRYRADWFLQFMGLENYPEYCEGGRLQNYCGERPFSDSAFQVLTRLVKSAAENIAKFDSECCGSRRSLTGKAITLIAISYLAVEELASVDGPSLLRQVLLELESKQAGAS